MKRSSKKKSEKESKKQRKINWNWNCKMSIDETRIILEFMTHWELNSMRLVCRNFEQIVNKIGLSNTNMILNKFKPIHTSRLLTGEASCAFLKPFVSKDAVIHGVSFVDSTWDQCDGYYERPFSEMEHSIAEYKKIAGDKICNCGFYTFSITPIRQAYEEKLKKIAPEILFLEKIDEKMLRFVKYCRIAYDSIETLEQLIKVMINYLPNALIYFSAKLGTSEAMICFLVLKDMIYNDPCLFRRFKKNVYNQEGFLTRIRNYCLVKEKPFDQIRDNLFDILKLNNGKHGSEYISKYEKITKESLLRSTLSLCFVLDPQKLFHHALLYTYYYDDEKLKVQFSSSLLCTGKTPSTIVLFKGKHEIEIIESLPKKLFDERAFFKNIDTIGRVFEPSGLVTWIINHTHSNFSVYYLASLLKYGIYYYSLFFSFETLEELISYALETNECEAIVFKWVIFQFMRLLGYESHVLSFISLSNLQLACFVKEFYNIGKHKDSVKQKIVEFEKQLVRYHLYEPLFYLNKYVFEKKSLSFFDSLPVLPFDVIFDYRCTKKNPFKENNISKNKKNVPISFPVSCNRLQDSKVEKETIMIKSTSFFEHDKAKVKDFENTLFRNGPRMKVSYFVVSQISYLALGSSIEKTVECIYQMQFCYSSNFGEIFALHSWEHGRFFNNNEKLVLKTSHKQDTIFKGKKVKNQCALISNDFEMELSKFKRFEEE